MNEVTFESNVEPEVQLILEDSKIGPTDHPTYELQIVQLGMTKLSDEEKRLCFIRTKIYCLNIISTALLFG